MNYIRKCPIPMAGLILSIFALGNLLQTVHSTLKTVAGVIGGILYVLFLLKVAVDFGGVREEMKKPPVASVFPTITMATMLIATYVKPLSEAAAQFFWWAGLIGHVLLMVYFTYTFVRRFSVKTVFPSWYIVYVGIAVAGVTAPAVGRLGIGQLSFWFGLLTYAILLPVVLYRIYRVKGMPAPTLPSLVILAAPASLLLAAYMNAFPEKNPAMVWILLVFSLVFFMAGLFYLIKQVPGKFIPTMSGFTFPMAISGIATAAAAKYFGENGTPLSWLSLLAGAQKIIATAVILYVLLRYLGLLFSDPKTGPAAQPSK